MQKINMSCENCKKVVSQPQVCSKCNLVYYCSDECCDLHLPEHTLFCNLNGSQKRGTQEIGKLLSKSDMWMMLTGSLLHLFSDPSHVLCCRVIYTDGIPSQKFTYTYKVVTDQDLLGARQTHDNCWTVILLSKSSEKIDDPEENDGLTISFAKKACQQYCNIMESFYPSMHLKSCKFPIMVNHHNPEHPIIKAFVNGEPINFEL